ncbi:MULTISPECIES: hypothetical protein [Moorena]|uniref:Uncharacterized protein n=1 Tax=Moorena producens 3L TaxID=489825 RepID=F4XJN5_9CYAN|nr:MULTISPECIES: hypothetical protein [Moorena]NEQ13868.1 hypothetical protein [Moorena sp. SIO3E2]NES44120.1 hypothetical protein [Moorena sp. SIO2C4]EGJ35315.1 hypothetical protein LYNGBM3L_08050 [Moorena producens 3L]NEP31727.1 hypothetical protein [Moorena sp. SIO3B2]NEP63938.1 hypothetical protein [Moorena sp. SIO3A5]
MNLWPIYLDLYPHTSEAGITYEEASFFSYCSDQESRFRVTVTWDEPEKFPFTFILIVMARVHLTVLMQ